MVERSPEGLGVDEFPRCMMAQFASIGALRKCDLGLLISKVENEANEVGRLMMQGSVVCGPRCVRFEEGEVTKIAKSLLLVWQRENWDKTGHRWADRYGA